jgi:radical SAM superfamily enzyme YgiQ (UPF0313 family)
MRALLVYPRFPKTFWSYEKVLELVGRKTFLPPLGLLTVAALLPQDWEFRLVDQNVDLVRDEDWEWADIVMLSAMIVQREDFLALIGEARRRGKPVVVGGPYPTSVPHEAEAAGADYLVLDEGEITIPPFLEEVATNGAQQFPIGNAATFRSSEKPDVTTTPIPRFDLVRFDVYDTMSIQFSRGCPFLCEFCDIIVLYGRKPRTKTPQQITAELDALYDLGWRGGVFLVDDNFIGNKRNAKILLRELCVWQAEHGNPFSMNTEASLDLAADRELLDLMPKSGFDTVFIGIETPDTSSLATTRKHQNNRRPMVEAVHSIVRSGMRVQAGFIIGFDGEQRGAGERIVKFIEETTIPTAMLSMLQALPNTALWKRLEQEGRLSNNAAGMNQSTLMNFLPTRPLREIADEYVEAFSTLYDPIPYLDRTYRHFLMLGAPRATRVADPKARRRIARSKKLLKAAIGVRAFLIICWRQGFVRQTRWKFWHHAVGIAIRNPQVFGHYIAVCAHNEHYLEVRRVVGEQINAQMAQIEGTPLANTDHSMNEAVQAAS